MSYEEIRKEIETSPMTWLPGLLAAATRASVRQGVFQPDGLVRFVTSVANEEAAAMAAPPPVRKLLDEG